MRIREHGIDQGVSYKADAVPLRATRTNLHATDGSETLDKETAGRGAGRFKVSS